MRQRTAVQRVLVSLFLVVLTCSGGIAGAVEGYVYEAIPAGDESGREKEHVEMRLCHFDDHLVYKAKTTRSAGYDVVEIKMEPLGGFISAVSERHSSTGELKHTGRISRNGNKVRVEPEPGKGSSIKEYDIPEGKVLAVDASLLVLLRSFPFDKNMERDFFMVDFSQHSVHITARQAAVEKVTVPAGEFECYRMEVTVNFFIFHPKITYWMTKERPHFLVKHSGKRGPFTRNYVTSLVRRKTAAKPADTSSPVTPK